ncbi:MAG: hypothetical protein ACI4QN_02550, partial [Candidatus Coproplasma sp.]
MSKIVYRGKKNSVTPSDGQELPESVAEKEVSPPAEVKTAESVPESSVAPKKRTSVEPKATTDEVKPVAAKAAPKKKDGTVTVKRMRTTAEKPAAEEGDGYEKVADKEAIKEEVAAADAVLTAEDAPEEIAPPPVKKYSDSEGFDKKKIVKYFKRHPKMQINTKVDRFSPELNQGLEREQVETRFRQFLFNDTNKKYSKSYASIFIGNICTFFNLLCLMAFIALLISGIKGITNYLVIVITAANIFIGIFQEIRSKLAVDKLSIMATSTTKAVREGETVEIATNEIVLDDVIVLELGNQVPADCILAEGGVEVNESLLTGESVSVKKQMGDLLYAGSFIASGSCKARVDKVGKETFLEKLTAKAKKYQRPKSELMNSIKAIIKTVSIVIFPIAIGVFFVTRSNGGFGGVTVEPWLMSETDSLALAKTCS